MTVLCWALLIGAAFTAIATITLMLATNAGKISDALNRRPIRKDH